jgi:hypothetical protein
MPQANENKCCKHKKCVTNTRRFRKLCLDPEFLLLSIEMLVISVMTHMIIAPGHLESRHTDIIF